MDKKRIFFIVAFLAISLLLGYAIYFVFFRKAPITPPPTLDSITTKGTNNFPQVGQGTGKITDNSTSVLPTNATLPTTFNPANQSPEINLVEQNNEIYDAVTTIVDSPVKSVTTVGGSTKFYNSADGLFYKIDNNGTSIPMNDNVFYNVENVTWSPANNESIIQYPDGSNIYYNFDTKKQVTLPKHWDDFSFSPQGDQIVAKSLAIAPENRWLIAAAPNGASARLIEPLGNNADKVIVDWSPNQQVVALSKTGEILGEDRQQILLVGLNKENFRGLVVEGRGLETKWSKQGTKILHSVYSSASEFKPELWIADGTPEVIGGNRKLLNVQTWASKCVMPDERFVYCGVPEKLDTGAGFAPNIANNTKDGLYKIDTLTGLKTQIPTEKSITVNSISVSADGTNLFITDKNQTGILKVNL